MASFTISRKARKKSPAFHICLLFIIFLCCLASCSYKPATVYIKEIPGKQENSLAIWAHSDIQPRIIKERKSYDTAIEDINENFPKIDVALVAGDIVHRKNSTKTFDWYIASKEKTSIKYWYEIAGNHDQKDLQNYLKYIKLPLHYSVQYGNILLLCMSDEKESPPSEISDAAFNWWKNMVENNQDKIIITMSHAYLKQSGLFGSSISSRNISHSERFAEVLKQYKTDVWLCGHTHMSHLLGRSIKIAGNLNGTLFLNVSTIREDTFNGVESFILYFTENSDILTVRSRDHKGRKFNLDDLSFRLSKKFQWSDNPPVMKPME